jgi:hypothetical protein
MRMFFASSSCKSAAVVLGYAAAKRTCRSAGVQRHAHTEPEGPESTTFRGVWDTAALKITLQRGESAHLLLHCRARLCVGHSCTAAPARAEQSRAQVLLDAGRFGKPNKSKKITKDDMAMRTSAACHPVSKWCATARAGGAPGIGQGHNIPASALWLPKLAFPWLSLLCARLGLLPPCALSASLTAPSSVQRFAAARNK